MKLTFVGTGAADWNWQDFPPGTRGATSTLLNASCLFDFGTGTMRNLDKAGVKASSIRDLVVTHSHPDHFRPDCVAELAGASKRKLRVWAFERTLADIPDGICEKHPLQKRDVFTAGGCKITVLPGNHFTRPGDESFHYLVEQKGVKLLYALDGAWMMAEEKRILAAALNGAALDAIIWDATRGATPADYRFADHNNLQMIDQLREGMVGCGLATDATLHVFDHIAQTLWPRTSAARLRLAQRHGGLLAEDGTGMEIGADGAK